MSEPDSIFAGALRMEEVRPLSPAIRASTDADLPTITAIYAHHVLHGTASFEEEAPDADEMERRRAGVLARGLPYLVAEAEGRVLGYAYAGPYHARPAYRFTLEDSIYVSPEAMGRGVGGRLLAALLEASEARGYRQMVALIGDSGNRASVALHERAGFRPVGAFTAVGFKFGRWLDVVLMQRALGGGGETTPLE